MSADTTSRKLPVRPDLDQLKHQARDLLRDIRRGDPSAIEEFNKHHPKRVAPDKARLADAQLALARSYEAPSWPRLVQACKLVDAIWRDDLDAVRELVVKNPNLLHEHATIRNSNWGPPMSYAANLGRNEIIKMLHKLGGTSEDQNRIRRLRRLEQRRSRNDELFDLVSMLRTALCCTRPLCFCLG